MIRAAMVRLIFDTLSAAAITVFAIFHADSVSLPDAIFAACRHYGIFLLLRFELSMP
jgi:hypothetical protein